MMNFALKTRNLVLKMMTFAAGEGRRAELSEERAGA